MHAETAKRVARREHRKMPSCSIEDMEQAIWEHACKWFKHYQGKDRRAIESYMSTAAKQFWSKERTDYMYFTGSYMYTPADVRRILAESAWSKLEECPDIDGRVDVRTAFLTLAPKQADAVFRCFGLGEGVQALTPSQKRNIYKGVDNMAHRLNDGLKKRPSDFNELAASL